MYGSSRLFSSGDAAELSDGKCTDAARAAPAVADRLPGDAVSLPADGIPSEQSITDDACSASATYGNGITLHAGGMPSIRSRSDEVGGTASDASHERNGKG